MGLLSDGSAINSALIDRYYEQYSHQEIAFTKELYSLLNIAYKKIRLKYKDVQWPCILYASSLVDAKIILSISDMQLKALTKSSLVTLKYSFLNASKGNFFSLYIPSRVAGATQHNGYKEMYFIQLAFVNKPPESLVYTLGSLLDAKKNASKRQEDRIPVNADSLRRLGLDSKKAPIILDGIQGDCILRDLSFGGLKAIVVAHKETMDNTVATVLLERQGKRKNTIAVKGTVLRSDPIVGQNDLTVIIIKFNEESNMAEYRMMINQYFGHQDHMRS